MVMIAQRAGCRISDFGFRMSDVGFQISDFGFRLARMPVLGGDTLAGRICGASRAAGPERRMSDFGFRISVGWDAGAGGRHLGCANCIASRAAGPYGWNPSDFSPWVFRPPIV